MPFLAMWLKLTTERHKLAADLREGLSRGGRTISVGLFKVLVFVVNNGNTVKSLALDVAGRHSSASSQASQAEGEQHFRVAR